MDIQVIPAHQSPGWASKLHDAAASIGTIEASSSSRMKDELVAWGVALRLAAHPDHVLAAAVSREQPDVVVGVLSPAHFLHAMALARSLVHRSGKHIPSGSAVSSHFGDLREVPFQQKPPQYVFDRASTWGLPGDMLLAVGATWPEMTLAPQACEDAIRSRSKDGRCIDVLQPPNTAISGMCRALHEAKEPLLSNAAWALQFMMKEHSDLVTTGLQQVAYNEKLPDDRLDITLQLADMVNNLALAKPATAPRVVVCLIPLPSDDASRLVVGYFHAGEKARVRLVQRYPESPSPQDEEEAGMEMIRQLFGRNRRLITTALGQDQKFVLKHGYHPDATLDQVCKSFVEDGFDPVFLVLEP